MDNHIRIATGIDGLDLILDGGLRYPRDGSFLMVILGGPGTGKTHLALELSVRMLARAESGTLHAYYSLDQTPAEIHGKLHEDFEYYGQGGGWQRLEGVLRGSNYQALLHGFTGDPEAQRYLLLASMRNAGRAPSLAEGTGLLERLEEDIRSFSADHPTLGDAIRPALITVDNVSLTSAGRSTGLRHELSRIRQRLAELKLNGILVIETPNEGADETSVSAAEYSADIIVRLGFHRFEEQFKERCIEIAKARYQFYFRGTHHFSIVGRSGKLRGARGQRPPGLHIYPSIPTLLSYLEYRRQETQVQGSGPTEFGIPGVTIRAGSSNGLVGPARHPAALTAVMLRFLAVAPGGLIISFQQSDAEIFESAAGWLPAATLRELRQRLFVRSFRAEYISAGKFLKDVYDDIEALAKGGAPVQRVALCGLSYLRWGFPLLHDSTMLIPWLVDFFKSLHITSLFTEWNPLPSDPSETPDSGIASAVDNLFTLRTKSDEIRLSSARSLNAGLERESFSVAREGDDESTSRPGV